jgi:hypothetical protein
LGIYKRGFSDKTQIMKAINIFLLFVLVLVPFSVWAQTQVLVDVPVAFQGSVANYMTYAAMALVATGVPMLVALIKAWFPKLKASYSHTFPVIAMLLGILLVWVINQLSTLHVAGVMGIFLGAAGIGLREVYDQTKQLWPTPPIVTTATTITTTPAVNLPAKPVPITAASSVDITVDAAGKGSN